MTNSDLIIIGAGPGGYELAAEQAAKGKKVTLIERAEMGGTCLNRGCIPTKCFCAAASTLLTISNAATFGIDVAGVTADYSRAAERMRGVVDQLRQGIEGMLKDVNVVRGEARLTANRTVMVGDEEFAANQVIIATGSRPASLPIAGAELALNSDDVLRLEQLPASVVIIGGGVIGMEFASIMAAYGVQVTVVEYCNEILPPFDREVAKRLRMQLSRRGVKTIVGAAVKEIAAEGDAKRVIYAGKKGDESVEAEAVIMAVGRRPVVPEGCAEAGIEIDRRGFIVVDDDFETTAEGIYAVGDCNGRCMLAHAASAQARVAVGEDVDLQCIPSAVFTVPECAMVGLTEEQCQAEEIEYKVSKAMFAGNGKALAMGEGEGFVKVIYSPNTGLILGTHIIGPHAADLIAEATVAMADAIPVDELASGIVHGHPTLSEALMTACANAK